MAACCAPDARGVEVCAFQEYVGGLFGHARVETAEHTCYAERFRRVANHQVGLVELSFYFVKCHERCASGACAHHDAVPFDGGQVETVERLTHAVENVVGYVHYIVDGAHANGFQTVAEPFGAFAHLDVADGQTAVARRALEVDDLHFHASVGAVGLEAVYGRAVQVAVAQMAVEIGSQVACHTVVRCRVDAVGVRSTSITQSLLRL